MMKFLATAFCVLALCVQSFSQKNMEMSQELLEALQDKDMETAQKVVGQLARIDAGELASEINTQEEILAFWINVYNGLAHYKLRKNPQLFKNRNVFFSSEIFDVAGRKISLDDIEHGILRKGMNKYSKGYFKNLFRDDWFKQFQAHHIDWRIHFALNCGAVSCPPIRIYDPDAVYKQLNENTREYLRKNVHYDKDNKVIYAPRIMNWYSGDFGGSEGAKDILKKNGHIPSTADVEIKYSDYDWSMDLRTFRRKN